MSSKNTNKINVPEARAACTVSVRISALEHEALDYAVEAYSVIEVMID